MPFTWLTVLKLAKLVLPSFFGAGIGALTASRLARKFKRQDELLDELRAIKAANTISSIICSSYLNLKEQHVAGLRRKFEEQRLKSQRFALSSGGRGEVRFEVELGSLTPIDVPVASLEKLIVDKISASTKAVALVVILKQTDESLKRMIANRNDLIAAHEKAPKAGRELAEWYFGLTGVDGKIDKRYADAVMHISDQTDDCIAFSMLLGEALVEYGSGLRKKLGQRVRPEIIVASTDFTSAKDKGLVPDFGKYKDWRENLVLVREGKPSILRRVFG